MNYNFRDFTGMKFGRLTVVRRGNGKREKTGDRVRITWVVICECNPTNEFEISASRLGHKKPTLSCGCLMPQTINIVGQTFGELTVIELSNTTSQHGSAVWVCKCSCGNVTTALGTMLRVGKRTTCGAIDKHGAISRSTGDIRPSLIRRLKTDAKRRNYEFSVDNGYLWNLFCAQSGKCVYSDDDISFAYKRNGIVSPSTTASLDRIDNNLGYTIGNLQWIHKDLNKMRMCLPEDVFLYWCNAVANKSTICSCVDLQNVTKTAFCNIKNRSKKRDFDFEITLDYINNLYHEQNGLCNLTGIPLTFLEKKIGAHETTASLDRIDSNLGYVIGNVRWVHKIVNKMRLNTTDDVFVTWCKKISNNIKKDDNRRTVRNR